MPRKAAIIGATGYTGVELLRILSRHPEVEIVGLGSRSHAGKPVSDAFPHLAGLTNLKCVADPLEAAKDAEIAFLALEHGTAAEVGAKLLEAGLKVIDLSADYRFKSAEVYQRWYKVSHPHPELLPEAVYGLPELFADEVREARLVANPGCYPIAVVLAVAPLFAHDLVDDSLVVADCKSGLSGAGRSRLQVPYLFSEVDENVRPYNVAVHRHSPEMEEQISRIARREVKVLFAPQVVPMSRGILACCYVKAKAGLSQSELDGAYENFYEGKPFVRVRKGEWPETKAVLGSNFCDVSAKLDEHTGMVVAISAIDNLTKGASGNAVQNMNLMLGLPETMGLDLLPLYP